MNKLQTNLSVIAIRAFLFCIINIFADIAVITTIAQSFEISFQSYAILSLLSAAAIGLISILAVRSWFKECTERDVHVLACIFGVAFLSGLFALLINRPNTDDYYYVPNVIFHLRNSGAPME